MLTISINNHALGKDSSGNISNIYAKYKQIENVQFESYAGPGKNYKYLGTISESDIQRFVMIEDGWFFIETEKNYVFVQKKFFPSGDVYNIPHAVYSLTHNTGDQILIRNLQYEVKRDIIVKSKPISTSARQAHINAGSKIILLSYYGWKKDVNIFEKFDPFIYIEYVYNGNRMRGFAKESEIFDMRNPLRDFEKVKINNAEFLYNKLSFFSTTGIPSNDLPINKEKWTVMLSDTFVDYNFDFLAAATAAIAMNDSDIDLSQDELFLYNLRSNSYGYVSTQKNGNTADKIGTAIDIFSMLNAALRAGNKNLVFEVNLERYEGEGRLLLRVGATSSYYGYQLYCDRDGDFYAIANIPPDAQDITPYLNQKPRKLRKEDSIKIINILAKNNIIFLNYRVKDLVKIVLNENLEELSFYLKLIHSTNNFKASYQRECRIAAQVALLLSKDKMLEEFLRYGVFPNASNFLEKKHIQAIIDPSTNNVERVINRLEHEWSEDGAEGDCATLDPNSVIFEASPNQLELILRYNQQMCTGELMCGATTRQLIDGRVSYINSYNKACNQ